MSCTPEKRAKKNKKRPYYWEWREIRLEVLDRDKTCVYCGKDIDDKTGTVDHVIPVARGGSFELDNLVGSCKTCNEAKGDKLPTDFIFSQHIKVTLARKTFEEDFTLNIGV